jgi:hypothetical protein
VRSDNTSWSGYKVHVTETCDTDSPHLIINVEATSAPVSDSAMTAALVRGSNFNDFCIFGWWLNQLD